MAKTSIEWCDHSINPIRAGLNGRVGHHCVKISTGCANCYSSRLQLRFGMPEFKVNERAGVEAFLDESKLEEVRRRRTPTRYFWCDMTDLFGEWVPNKWIEHCFVAMKATPQHTHLVLTKRPQRMLDFVKSRQMGLTPLQNIWLGVSVENQQTADERIPLLLQTPAAVRFISAEPLLGPINLAQATRPRTEGDWMNMVELGQRKLHWVIVGGESGPGARPMRLEWARSVVEQCKAAGVPCFVKQLGAVPIFDRDEAHLFLSNKKGGDWAEWPEDLRVREYPLTKETINARAYDETQRHARHTPSQGPLCRVCRADEESEVRPV